MINDNTENREVVVLSSRKEQTMSSLEIAELTEKNHYDVLRDIDKMFSELELAADLRSVKTASYKDKSGKSNRLINLNRRETDILISGYSIKYRAAIVDRWHELEAAIVRPMSQIEIIAASAQALVAQERKITEIEQRVQHLELNTSTHETHFTALAFTNIAKIKATKKQLNSLGRRAAKLSRDNSIPINKVRHEKYGEINSYKEDMLELASSQLGLI